MSAVLTHSCLALASAQEADLFAMFFAAAAAVAVPPPAQRYGRVFVGLVEAAPGLSFEAIFVPGLAEKLFPGRIVEEPILLDAARDRLNARLVTNEDRLSRERLALRGNASGAIIEHYAVLMRSCARGASRVIRRAILTPKVRSSYLRPLVLRGGP
jgi:hypothetical protein